MNKNTLIYDSTLNAVDKKLAEGKPKMSMIPPAVFLANYCRDDSLDSISQCIYDILYAPTNDTTILNSISRLLDIECQKEYDVVIFEQLARVQEYGAKKHGAYNWRAGYPYSIYLDAAIRHLVLEQEEEKDAESGFRHIYHAIINLGILHFYITSGVGTNDVIFKEKD